jgi:hypothetical protein
MISLHFKQKHIQQKQQQRSVNITSYFSWLRPRNFYRTTSTVTQNPRFCATVPCNHHLSQARRIPTHHKGCKQGSLMTYSYSHKGLICSLNITIGVVHDIYPLKHLYIENKKNKQFDLHIELENLTRKVSNINIFNIFENFPSNAIRGAHVLTTFVT